MGAYVHWHIGLEGHVVMGNHPVQSFEHFLLENWSLPAGQFKANLSAYGWLSDRTHSVCTVAILQRNRV